MSGTRKSVDKDNSTASCDDSSRHEMEHNSSLEHPEARATGSTQANNDMEDDMETPALRAPMDFGLAEQEIPVLEENVSGESDDEVPTASTCQEELEGIEIKMAEFVGIPEVGEEVIVHTSQNNEQNVTPNGNLPAGCDVQGTKENVSGESGDEASTASTCQEELEGIEIQMAEFVGIPEDGEEVIVHTSQNNEQNVTPNEDLPAGCGVQGTSSRKRPIRVRTTHNDPLSKSMIQVKYSYIKPSNSSFTANTEPQAQSQTQDGRATMPAQDEQATIPTYTISSDDTDSDDLPLAKLMRVNRAGNRQRSTPNSGEIDISEIQKNPKFAIIMKKKLVISVKNLSEAEIEQLSYRHPPPPVNVISTEMLKSALEQIEVLKQLNERILSQMASQRRSTGNNDEEACMAVAGPSTRRSFGNAAGTSHRTRSITHGREFVSRFTFEPTFPEISVDWLRLREHLITREFVREIMRILFEAEELLNKNATGKRTPVNRTNPDNTVVKEPVDPIRVDFIRRKVYEKYAKSSRRHRKAEVDSVTRCVSSICSAVTKMKDKTRFKSNTYVRDEIPNEAQGTSSMDRSGQETTDKTPEQEAQPPQGRVPQPPQERVCSAEKKVRVRLRFEKDKQDNNGSEAVNGSNGDNDSEADSDDSGSEGDRDSEYVQNSFDEEMSEEEEVCEETVPIIKVESDTDSD